jgi:hypothetical protein
MAEGVRQYKDVTLTYSAPAGGLLYVTTDMPGGTLTLRRTIALPVTTGLRETKTFPLDNPSLLEGKLIQWKITSGGTVIPYSGFVRFRPVGTYIDGASGDVWETQPLGLGG